MATNKNIGGKGEKLALDYLIADNYEIIAENWTSGHKEIDIITRKDNCYIFFEIKTRTTLSLGFPEESITPSKMRSVTGAAQIFLEGKTYKDIRFDVIAIYIPPEGEMDFKHIKDAFY